MNLYYLSEWGQERIMLTPGRVTGWGSRMIVMAGCCSCSRKPSNGRFSGPWRPFDAKLAPLERTFRGAGREIGPGAWNVYCFYEKTCFCETNSVLFRGSTIVEVASYETLPSGRPSEPFNGNSVRPSRSMGIPVEIWTEFRRTWRISSFLLKFIFFKMTFNISVKTNMFHWIFTKFSFGFVYLLNTYFI